MAQDRDKLVADHIEYARALANQLGRNLPSRPEMEELTAFALAGLTEAASRYDPDKGAAFRTFSYYRIRGAMFDGLRRSGWLGRCDHARVKAQQQADDLLEAAAAVPGAAGRDAMQAARELKDLLGDVTAIVVATVDSFDRIADEPGAAGSAEAMEESVATSETRTVMDRALRTLPERERELVQRVYYGEETIEEAGKSLGISKSWASRMHAKAITRLREVLEQATVTEPPR